MLCKTHTLTTGNSKRITKQHTLHPALEDGTDRGFRNVGIQQSDAGETPKRIHNRITKQVSKFL